MEDFKGDLVSRALVQHMMLSQDTVPTPYNSMSVNRKRVSAVMIASGLALSGAVAGAGAFSDKAEAAVTSLDNSADYLSESALYSIRDTEVINESDESTLETSDRIVLANGRTVSYMPIAVAGAGACGPENDVESSYERVLNGEVIITPKEAVEYYNAHPELVAGIGEKIEVEQWTEFINHIYETRNPNSEDVEPAYQLLDIVEAGILTQDLDVQNHYCREDGTVYEIQNDAYNHLKKGEQVWSIVLTDEQFEDLGDIKIPESMRHIEDKEKKIHHLVAMRGACNNLLTVPEEEEEVTTSTTGRKPVPPTLAPPETTSTTAPEVSTTSTTAPEVSTTTTEHEDGSTTTTVVITSTSPTTGETTTTTVVTTTTSTGESTTSQSTTSTTGRKPVSTTGSAPPTTAVRTTILPTVPPTAAPDTLPPNVTPTTHDSVPNPSTIWHPDSPPVTATTPTTERPAATLPPPLTTVVIGPDGSVVTVDIASGEIITAPR